MLRWVSPFKLTVPLMVQLRIYRMKDDPTVGTNAMLLRIVLQFMSCYLFM